MRIVRPDAGPTQAPFPAGGTGPELIDGPTGPHHPAAARDPGPPHGLRPFAVAGVLSVITGGLLAAVTARAPSEHATWSVAYLVLVCGVAQIGLGLGRTRVTAAPSNRVAAIEFTGWNLGNAAVLLGTVTDATALVDVGGVLLVVALTLFARDSLRGPTSPPGRVDRWLRYGHRLLVLLLLASVPVGLILARVRDWNI